MNDQEKSHLPDSGFDQMIENVTSERETGSAPRELVPLAESLELAKSLLTKYESEMKGQYGKDIDGWSDGLVFTDYQKSIAHYIEETPHDILKRFSAHGVTRKSEIDRIAGALNILANKSIKGECGPLVGSGQLKAYISGDFLVISKLDMPLPILDARDGRQQSRMNGIGWLAEIGAFVVDTRYYPMIDELRRMFPDVNIIKANQLPEYLKSIIS